MQATHGAAISVLRAFAKNVDVNSGGYHYRINNKMADRLANI